MNDLYLFRVVNANPEKMVRANPTHMLSSKAVIRIRRFHPLVTGTGRIAAVPANDGKYELDLVPWLSPSVFQAVCAELRLWEVKKLSVLPELYPPRHLRDQSDLLERFGAGNAAMAAFSHPQWEQRGVVVRALSAQGASSDADRSSWLPFSKLDGVHQDTCITKHSRSKHI